MSQRRRQRILQVFLDHPDQRIYGLDVWRLAGRGRTIYIELGQLEDDGWVLSDWENPDADSPRRRVYWLNPNPPARDQEVDREST